MLSTLQCRADALGAETLFGDTLRSNDAMLKLARKAGFSIAPTPGDWKQTRFEKKIRPGAPGAAKRVSLVETAAG